MADRNVALKESSELVILGVIFDPKLSFERLVRSVAASASQRIGIMRRGMKIFDSVEVVHPQGWSKIVKIYQSNNINIIRCVIKITFVD